MEKELLFKDEVYGIIGAAIEVHRHLSCGFLEGIHQEAMEPKVGDRLGKKEQSQALHYLHRTQMRLGLLINFGDAGRLDWERIIL